MLSTAMALLTCAFGLDAPAFSCALITMGESVARSAVGGRAVWAAGTL